MNSETSGTPAAGKRAVLYLRVSTKEQAGKGGEAEGYSIPTQRLVCQQKASALDAVVAAEFVDAGESARSADRPALQRMLAHLERERADYVIVHKIDRLARNRMDDLMITVALELAGVQLVSCSEQIDNKTPAGKLTHGLMALIPEWYSSNLSSEVKTKTLQKVKNGGTPGKAPVGYLNIRRRVEGREIRTVEIDPDRAPHVRWAFEAYATGEWTLRGLTIALADRGLTTVPSAEHREKPLSLSQVHRLLRNRYYIGVLTWDAVEHAGAHTPLIPRKLFEEVQNVLDAHNVAGEKQRIHHHYLKGTVWCGDCGSRLAVTHSTNRWGTVYPYYFCLGRQRYKIACRQKAVLIDTVDERVAAYWQHIRFAPEYAELLRQLLGEELASARGPSRNGSPARPTNRRTG